MKNTQNLAFWRRGLALLLAVCLAAGYVPVPGHAEGCTHEHGEDCYEVTTECVHTHDASCYTDPALMEAGEEPDACGHECTEETGCVVRALNCGHVHDEECGEAVEVQEEEPKEEPQEEPEPQPEEAKEEPQEEPEAPQEPQAKTVTAWTWIDEAEALDPETGKLCLTASEEEHISFDQIVEVLPKAIEATVDGEGETLPIAAWACGEYPEDGAYEGSFVFTAELPEGYALGDGVEALTVAVEFGGAVVMMDCPHTAIDMITGKCVACHKQIYKAKIDPTGRTGWTTTLEKALTEAQETENCTVTLLCDVSEEVQITGGSFTLDLNGRTISSSGTVIRLRGGALTLTDSGSGGKVTGDNIAVDISDGELNIRGGTYSGGIYGLHIRTYSPEFVSISGGIFEKIGLADSMDGNLVDCLAPNHAFYADPDGKTIVNAAVKKLSGTVYVREHTHHFDVNGVCPCGYQCPHTEAAADMTTGKCACGKVQVYKAKIGTTGYGSLGGAMNAAEERPGCTVTLLCDVSNEESGGADTLVVRSGGYTLDLNGHKVERTIGGVPTIWVSGSLVIADSAGGGQIANTCGYSAIDIPEGSLTIQGGTVSGDVTAGKAATLTISGGAFMGKLRHTKHNLVEDLAEGCAFYADPEGRTIVSGAAEELTGPVYVLGNHSHQYVNGKCDCGRCSHASVNMDTGRCAQCGYQVYLAKVGVNHQGYATLREAFSAAAQTPNSTVTLLADVNVLEEDTNYCYVLDTGTFTLDLNGRKIINDEEDDNYGREIFRIQGANLTIEGDAPGSEIRRAEIGASAIKLNSGSLTIRGGKIAGTGGSISTRGGELTISGGTFDGSLYISANTAAAISGGSFIEIWTDRDSLLDVLAPYYAFCDADSGKILDASGTDLKIVSVREHIHAKRDGYETCVCGYTFPYAAVTQAPVPNTLAYTGQPQDLVTPGTAQGGTTVYSLTENGTYSETIPRGTLPKTYTVYYKVQGDDGHLDTEPKKVSATVAPTDRYLDLTDTGLTGTVTVGGKDYPIEESDGKRFVTLPEEGTLFTTYTYGGDSAHPYPTGMNVYAIERNATGSTAAEIPDFQNLLTYAGCSIRISGKQGIRMITSLDETTKKILTGKGLNGYTLEEYGTVVSWTENLTGENFLRLGESYARSNYAYLKGKADPVFARKNGVMQYTNVLLLENLTAADYDKNLTLRAYIKLKDADGNTVTLYGGTVTRSIYYVATQNEGEYKPGTTGYKFVHKIIDAVENP